MNTPGTHEDLLNALYGPVISAYSEEQAIEDGVLHHLFPERWPWALVTDGVLNACEATGERDGRGRLEVVVPLMIDAIRATQKALKLHRGRVARVAIEFTAAGTVVVVPNSKGGLTIMLPHEE